MSQNKTLFERSQKVIPGGVNSPVRAFKSVGGTPIFFKKGLGSKLWDKTVASILTISTPGAR